MADMVPVAAQIQPPNPQQGLGLMSSILGIQQQRQALQTGQYQQQSAQAEATQAQQRSAELQAAQALIKNGVTAGRYTTQDGGFDRIKAADDIQTVAPTYGQTISNQLLSGANEAVANRTALQSLTTEQRKVIGGTISSLAADPQVNNTKVIDAMDALLEQNPDPQFRRLILSAATHMPSSGRPADLQQALSTIAGSLTQKAPIEGTTNAAGQIINRNPMTGALSPAAGAGLNPTSVKVAAATQTASGSAADDNARNNEISRSVAPSRQAITLADQVSNLTDQIRTGRFSKEIANIAGTVDQKDQEAAARQLLGKYTAQLKTLATANAPTDSARGIIDAGFPDPDTMTPDAIKKSAEYIKGGMLMNLSRAANARKFTAAAGGTQGLRAADDTLTQNADPLMYTYQNLKPGAERQEFIRRHFTSAADAADFVRRKNAVEHYGGFAQ